MPPQALPTCASPTREDRAPSFLSPYTLVLGVALYAAAALADVVMTVRGMGGDLELEGNPIMRAVMGALGVEAGLLVQKVGVVLDLLG
jgi:hypothetical protein